MAQLAFEEFGSGSPVILIHGFPMNKKIWSSFAPSLSEHFKVYTIDLPGFGGSPIPNSSFSIQSVAQDVLTWITKKAIGKSVVIGHSLGGYVALAMAGQSPGMLAGLGLFHSTALADSEEKKLSRDKVVEFVEKNGAPAFTSNFIPPLFADKNHPGIESVKAISVEASAQAVTGYTLAMRDRSDATSVLKNFENPVLFLVGKEDPGIPIETIEKQASLCQRPEVHILAKVGHMGMVEAEKKTLGIIQAFASKAFPQ